MFIPSGVNHLEFLKAAKQKGIKVQSRFVGVSINKNGGSTHWVAKYQENGRNILFERFPFTEQGEKDAADKYTSFMQDKVVRRGVKKEFKTNKNE